jgi:nitrogen-specific signal transduction histidine kinase/ActR/RegA family two-component response regulator
MLDISLQKKLEEQLSQAQKMEAVGQMAGGIAHNFNNVLTALVGHTELALLEISPDHPAYRDLEGIKKSTQRATKLTQQLLAFTRHQVIHPRILNFNELMLSMETMLHQLVADNIDLVILLASDLGLIEIDAGQFEQVLTDLVINARDAMPNGGKLTIETMNIRLDSAYASQHAGVIPGDYIMLAVSDTGTGMAQEVKTHIFEPFFTTKEVGEGTGLGLSTCFGFVKQNGGHIWAYSEPDQGTTIKVYLPRVANETGDSPQIRSDIHRRPTGTQTILLVEDEPILRDLAFRLLSQQGYTVLVATDGEEALRQVKAQAKIDVHLLITDVGLPRMGGDVLAQQLIALHPTLKVLFISGYTDRAIARRGILDTDVAVLSKPFTPDALVYKVHSILSGEDK